MAGPSCVASCPLGSLSASVHPSGGTVGGQCDGHCVAVAACLVTCLSLSVHSVVSEVCGPSEVDDGDYSARRLWIGGVLYPRALGSFGSSVRRFASPDQCELVKDLRAPPPSPDREHAYEGFQSRGRLFASLSGHQANSGKALDWTRIKSPPS
jgi:hypothetical protein